MASLPTTHRPTESTPLRAAAPRTHMYREASEKGPLNTSSNVILLYRMHELRMLSSVNFGLAMAVLLYLGLNVVLFVLNLLDHNDDDCAAAARRIVSALERGRRRRDDAAA